MSEGRGFYFWGLAFMYLHSSCGYQYVLGVFLLFDALKFNFTYALQM